jgi:Stress responsive A/B Barrel Domain
MRTSLFLCMLAVAALFIGFGDHHPTEAAEAKGPMIAHIVYFSLKDNSPEAKKKLVDSCKKYLTKHPGEVFFAAGTLAEDLKRPVNDRDFDVALHIVFKDMASHDKYQEAKRHKQFIEENKENWKKVRVFDSMVGE